MRQEPDFFGDQDLGLVYVAKKLKEALRLEKLLTDAGVDYLVEPDKYSGGVIFRSERIGAFFYVAPEDDTAARERNASRRIYARTNRTDLRAGRNAKLVPRPSLGRGTGGGRRVGIVNRNRDDIAGINILRDGDLREIIRRHGIAEL